MRYSPLVESHFRAPRNIGRFAPAADVLVGRSGSKDQGVEVVLSARIANGRIAALNHLVYGCPHTVAAASWLTEQIVGATLDDLTRWRWREVSTALEVPPEKWGRLLVLEDAVRALERTWRERGSSHAQTA
jgi:NifU-like protein involved in Fe-S cluster formation